MSSGEKQEYGQTVGACTASLLYLTLERLIVRYQIMISAASDGQLAWETPNGTVTSVCCHLLH